MKKTKGVLFYEIPCRQMLLTEDYACMVEASVLLCHTELTPSDLLA